MTSSSAHSVPPFPSAGNDGSRFCRAPDGYFSEMFWLAAVLAVVCAASFLVGFVLVANGTGVAPQRRTQSDPTGVKRAGARVKWRDLFRGIPSSIGVLLDKDADRGERLAALGALSVLAAMLAGLGAVLALIAGFVPS